MITDVKVSATHARNNLSQLINEALTGATITILRSKKPIAILVSTLYIKGKQGPNSVLSWVDKVDEPRPRSNTDAKYSLHRR